uniref:Signal peptidase complex subunit 1 n=1 Tax=Elphidium margaritaceum TaxID=933848 RepID=A0A7S0XMX7_9EUKA
MKQSHVKVVFRNQTMDWIGIRRAERIAQLILILSAFASVIYAYINEWFPYTTFGMVGGFGVASLISVPDWPWFNMHPVGWHTAIDPDKVAKHYQELQRKKDKKSKKQENVKKDKPKKKTK